MQNRKTLSSPETAGPAILISPKAIESVYFHPEKLPQKLQGIRDFPSSDPIRFLIIEEKLLPDNQIERSWRINTDL